MSSIKVLSLIILVLGLGLCMAWAGGASGASQQPAAADQASTPPEKRLVLIKSDAESIILELFTPLPAVEEVIAHGAIYQLITVEGYGQTDEVGHPQLPAKGTLLGIPPGADFSLNVLEAEEEILVGQYNVYPVPQLVVELDLAGDVTYRALEFVKDETVYSKNASYPSEVAETGSTGFIRDQRVVPLRLFPFRYNPVSGELRHYRRIRVELSFSYPHGGPQVMGTSQEVDPFKQVLENSLLNYESASNWEGRPSATFSVADAGEQSGTSYKVLVDEDGIYQLTYDALAGAGIDVESIDPGTFKLHNQGDESAIHMVDENDNGDFDPEDSVLFYGQRMTGMYTDTNIYWLSMGGSPGLRMEERDGTLGAGELLTSFHTTTHWEEDKYYQSKIPKPATVPSEEEIDHWFGGYIAALSGPASESYTIMVDKIDASPPPYSSTVRGYLHGYTSYDDDDPDHHTRVYLNGNELELDYDEEFWDGQVGHEFETEAPLSYLVDGANVISVECPRDLGVPRDIVFVDRFEIDYRRTYTVENDSVLFDGDEAGTWQYRVGTFSTDTIEVFDVTDPLGVSRIVSTTIVGGAGSYALQFEDTIDGEHHYLALTEAQYQTPLDIVEYTPAGLKNTSNGADYIIITHPDFYTDVLPLRDHRAGQDLRTVVVDVGDIYDEFNHGMFDPHAIRDFLEYAYYNWTPPKPSYVLLVGDGNWDFKNNTGRGEPNYVPPYLMYVDKWVGEADADNRYVCVSGGDTLADLHLGRLPAQTAAQVSTMVGKIIDYEQNLPEGDWQNRVLFVADDRDPEAGDFDILSNDIADNHLRSPYEADKVYYRSPLEPGYNTPGQVKTAIFDAFDTGRLLINYVGHSAPWQWGLQEGFLTVGDINSAGFPATQRTPVMVPMTCLDGYFIHPSPPGSDFSCVGESVVRVEGKGAVASWSPTSEGRAHAHHYLHEGLYDALFAKDVHQLGPATMLGKLNLHQNVAGEDRALLDTYLLFGDPATTMPIRRCYLFLPLVVKGHCSSYLKTIVSPRT